MWNIFKKRGVSVIAFLIWTAARRTALPIVWKKVQPVWVEQWPLTKEKLKALNELVTEQFELGHIVFSSSPWNPPVFVIKKETGEWKMLIDKKS